MSNREKPVFQREREKTEQNMNVRMYTGIENSRNKYALYCNTLSFRTHSRVANNTHYFNRRKTM